MITLSLEVKSTSKSIILKKKKKKKKKTNRFLEYFEFRPLPFPSSNPFRFIRFRSKSHLDPRNTRITRYYFSRDERWSVCKSSNHRRRQLISAWEEGTTTTTTTTTMTTMIGRFFFFFFFSYFFLFFFFKQACPSSRPSSPPWRRCARSRIPCSRVSDSPGHPAVFSHRWYAGPRRDPLRPRPQGWCAPRFRRRHRSQLPRRPDASLQQATPRSVKAKVRVWISLSLSLSPPLSLPSVLFYFILGFFFLSFILEDEVISFFFVPFYSIVSLSRS